LKLTPPAPASSLPARLRQDFVPALGTPRAEVRIGWVVAVAHASALYEASAQPRTLARCGRANMGWHGFLWASMVRKGIHRAAAARAQACGRWRRANCWKTPWVTAIAVSGDTCPAPRSGDTFARASGTAPNPRFLFSNQKGGRSGGRPSGRVMSKTCFQHDGAVMPKACANRAPLAQRRSCTL